MDPASVIGVAASAIQIVGFIGSTIQGLHTLRGKFKDADVTIRLIISKLSTIKAAVFQIRDWAEFNSDDSPKEIQFMDGLHVALDGCQAAIDVLAEEVKDLAAATKAPESGDFLQLSFRARVAAVWSEDTMKAHEDRLHGQVQALQLLLMAGQWYASRIEIHTRDAGAQRSLLSLKENKRLIQKIADDTKTIRESQSSAASQASKSVRHSTTPSIVGGVLFDFDNTFDASELYNGLNAFTTEGNSGSAFMMRGALVGDSISSNDEGYETGISLNDPRSPTASDALPEVVNFDINRSRGLVSKPGRPEPIVQRWLSTSSSGDSSQKDKGLASSKKRFWSGRLGRLNTFSSTSILSGSDRQKTVSPSTSFTLRNKRASDSKLSQSIDFGSTNGLQTPAIVRAAQAGSGVEIQALLSNGHDIEARHEPTGRTALAVAAHCGNTDLVDLLLFANANANVRDTESCTPLHLAASRDHFAAIQLLLDEGADIEAKDGNGRTPLWTAAHAGHAKSVEALVKRGAKVNARANDQCTALHVAAKKGDVPITELLFRAGSDVEARDSQFMTALHHACDNGQLSVVDYLLQKGASIDAPGNESKSPLHFAAAKGHLDVVQFLFKKKPNFRFTSQNTSNPLHLASRNGHAEVVSFLVESKFSLDHGDSQGLTPLHLAVIGQHFDVVELLLRRNHILLQKHCKQGRTPLHYACRSDSADIVSLLLNAGANAEEEVWGDKRRPIHIAAARGSTRIVDILIKKKIAISSRDANGDRPLGIACQNGHVQIVEKLLACNEPLRMRIQDRPNKDSPLCIAAKAGHLSVVQLLIKKGASIKERDEFGYIPIRYAAYYGHPEVLEALMQAGAELYDEGEESHGWGFLLMPATIGFSDSTDISEERKDRVRQLLAEMERRHYEGGSTPNSTSKYRPGPFIPRQELAAREIEQTAARAELPTANTKPDKKSSNLPNLSRLSLTSQRQRLQRPKRYSNPPSQATSTRTSRSASPSTVTASRRSSRHASPISPGRVSPESSLPMHPADAAALIQRRQAEIEQLQQYLAAEQKKTRPDSWELPDSSPVYELA
ncbi:ankyrin repeat protein [Rutstroemia sp. NJR-2017a BBW]|nr:ankyrin repeat protein [Rutstroemia sp. NJR-2017a BBW]